MSEQTSGFGSPPRHESVFGPDSRSAGSQKAALPPRQIAWAVAGVLIVLSMARIVATYKVFSQVLDEPAHVACGMEWLDRRTYTYEVFHPPLARIAVALGPYLDGLRSGSQKDMWREGNAILYARGRYSHNLALARLGVLPFYVLAAVIVWIWSRRLFGEGAAVVAVLLFTSLPPVLAHAGLATTDMPLTASLSAALLALTVWIGQPTRTRTLILGLTVTLAVLSKFSALMFLPACGLTMFVCFWAEGRPDRSKRLGWRRLVKAVGIVAGMAALLVWAGYRFSLHPLNTLADRPHATIDRYFGASGRGHDRAYAVAETLPVPAPEFLVGIGSVVHDARLGRPAYLLGKIRQDGWWYFFPVALGVKSPIPFLLLACMGLMILLRRGWRSGEWGRLAPGAAAIVLLLVCLPSRINIGLRHILPIYPLLSIVAGYAALRLWSAGRYRRAARGVVVGLISWQVIVSALAHPDYLAYFNEVAERHPDRILVDSDLDWGQDLLRLSEAVRSRGLPSLAIAYFGSADLTRHGLPPSQKLGPYQQATGWIAISEFKLKFGEYHHPPYKGYEWLEAYQPVALVGRSIRLYYVPEKADRAASPRGP